MKTRKKQRPRPARPESPAGRPSWWRLPGRGFWRAAAWLVGPALGLGLVALGVWYALSPPLPEVRLDGGADPELAAEVSRARWAIRRSPWSDEARGRAAMLLHVHKINAAAAAFYAQAEELNSAEPRWPYLHSFVVPDDPPAALALLRRAVSLAGGRPRAPDAPVLRLADTYLEQELLAEAGEAYGKLLDGWADHPRAHLGLARIAVLRDQPREALAHLRVCLGSPTTRKAAHTLLAEVQRRLGDAEAAARAAGQAAEMPPDVPWPDPWLDEARNLLVGRNGRLYRLSELQQQNRLAEAQALGRKTTEEYADLGQVMRGWQLIHDGKPAEAEAIIREALRLNPSSVDGHFHLGKALFAQKRYAEAAESFRRVTELEPAHGPGYREWGRCAAALGDRKAAIRRLRQALRYMPHDAETHRELGEQLDADGDREGALDHLGQAARLDPKDQRAADRLEKVRGGGKEGKR
jgi:tetratricopeptide (TPR) repeat protein